MAETHTDSAVGLPQDGAAPGKSSNGARRLFVTGGARPLLAAGVLASALFLAGAASSFAAGAAGATGNADHPAPRGAVSYRVQDGDTVYGIAQRYGVTPQQVVDANGLGNPDSLTLGQTLLVPNGSGNQNGNSGRQASNDSAGGARAGTEPTSRGGSRLESWQASFLSQAVQAARATQADTKVPASVTIAQAIIESNWGRDTIGANNYFGVKADSGQGPAGVVWAETQEYSDGGWTTVNAAFRAYQNMAQSFVDHAQFLVENDRYAEAMRNTGDPKRFAQLVQDAGYATDPGYAQKLIDLMDRYDLYQYDHQPANQPSDRTHPATSADLQNLVLGDLY